MKATNGLLVFDVDALCLFNLVLFTMNKQKSAERSRRVHPERAPAPRSGFIPVSRSQRETEQMKL